MKYTVTMLVFAVASLLALGMVILYSSSMGLGGTQLVTRQLMWCGLGLVACVICASIDYKHLKKIAWVFLFVAIALLILVLHPKFGVVRGGARRWFDFGFASVQPSEIAKLAMIIWLAYYGEKYAKWMPTFWKGIALPGVFIGAVLGLIFLEPDYGTMMLVAAICGILLLLSGVRLIHVVPPALVGLTGVVLAVWNNPVRLQRIMAFLYPEEYKATKGYQSYQAMIALGSGGPTGLGLGDGRQKQGFVPESPTDFIYAIVGEELGLVGTLSVIAAFLIILYCGLAIAWRSRDTFGFLLASGITFLISLQAFINIGVVTSALPNKGLPLPFMSHGGSNLFIMLASIGLLLNIARHSVEVQTVELAEPQNI